MDPVPLKEAYDASWPAEGEKCVSGALFETAYLRKQYKI